MADRIVYGPGWSDSWSSVPHNGATVTNATFVQGSTSYYALNEWITTQNGFGSWHDFDHYKWTQSMLRPTVRYGVGNKPFTGPWAEYIHSTPSWEWGQRVETAAGFGSPTTPLTGLPILGYGSGLGRSISDPPGLNDLISTGLTNILPGIQPKFSLLNDLIELKDFKTVPKTLAKVSRLNSQLIEAFFRIKKKSFGKLTLKQILDVIADVTLQNSFNVQPTIADISSLRESLSNYKRVAKKLLAQQNQVLTSHWATSLANSYTSSDVTKRITSGDPLGDYHEARRIVKYSACKFVVSVDYSYSLPGISPQLAEAYVLLDMLGVNFNPAIIWNAIPWTFVVDWVFGVSKWLDQYKLRNLEPVTTIRRCCWSLKVSRSIDTYIRIGVGTPVGGSTVPVTQIVEDIYKRRLFDPNVAASIQSSGINLREFILSGALAWSRFPKSFSR